MLTVKRPTDWSATVPGCFFRAFALIASEDACAPVRLHSRIWHGPIAPVPCQKLIRIEPCITRGDRAARGVPSEVFVWFILPSVLEAQRAGLDPEAA